MIDTDETPSYPEIVERFGEKISIQDALEKTHEEQKKHQDLVAIGSVLASGEVYGYRDLRDTGRGLDFVADPGTIKSMNEEYEESWFYDGSYVFSTDDIPEWMIGVIPCNEEVFEDSELESFSVDAYDVMSPETISTSQGDISVVKPEIGYVSKLRRYVMQKNNRDDFKNGDLVDLASISLNNREEDILDYRLMDELVDRFIGEKPNTDEMLHDTIESIEEEGIQMDSYEIEGSLREIREYLDHPY